MGNVAVGGIESAMNCAGLKPNTHFGAQNLLHRTSHPYSRYASILIDCRGAHDPSGPWPEAGLKHMRGRGNPPGEKEMGGWYAPQLGQKRAGTKL